MISFCKAPFAALENSAFLYCPVLYSKHYFIRYLLTASAARCPSLIAQTTRL